MVNKKDLQHLSDQELIVIYQQNHDTATVGILYKRYVNLVYGLCFKYLNNHHDSEDTVAEIFYIMIDKLKVYQITYFKSWLYIISKNYIFSVLRKKKNFLGEINEELTESFMENDEDFHLNIKHINSSGDSLLKEGLGKLKESQKVCLELFYIQNKSYIEVAEVTGFDLKQVKSHIQNGKRNLKNFLEEKGYNHEN